MNSQSIEFDRIKEDSPLPKIVRRSFRVPVEDEKNIWILINNTRYPIQDMCLGGVSITVKDNLMFFVDQALLNCELNYFDMTIKKLNARIVHVSAALGQGWKYGLMWTELEKNISDQISVIVYELKKQLLGNEIDSVDGI